MKGNQMSKHTMKRLGFGDYKYRGHVIRRVINGDTDRFSHWNILDEFGNAVESANTLRECRYWINKMCNDHSKA
jgi:hypothetical protein